ncbi:MAG: hypothetical protein DSY89_09040 [Deltaproteobacteria bacterium]|nr:MAG: hypothetical protein DSY89_09040 [Deltaproteobacteria bacterium]
MTDKSIDFYDFIYIFQNHRLAISKPLWHKMTTNRQTVARSEIHRIYRGSPDAYKGPTRKQRALAALRFIAGIKLNR